jgi:hypothetical protein
MSQNDVANTESNNPPVVVQLALVVLHDTRKVTTLTTATDYETAAESLKQVKHNLKMVDELEESEKRPHLDELKAIREKYNPSRTQYSLAEGHLKKLLGDYNIAQERLRREAQAKAQQLADREREKLRKQAEKALQKGKVDSAVALAERADAVVAPVIANDVPKVDGVHTVEKWEFVVINEALIPAVYKTVDLKKIDSVVSVMKEAAEQAIPGIKVERKLVVASKSKQPEV